MFYSLVHEKQPLWDTDTDRLKSRVAKSEVCKDIIRTQKSMKNHQKLFKYSVSSLHT